MEHKTANKDFFALSSQITAKGTTCEQRGNRSCQPKQNKRNRPPRHQSHSQSFSGCRQIKIKANHSHSTRQSALHKKARIKQRQNQSPRRTKRKRGQKPFSSQLTQNPHTCQDDRKKQKRSQRDTPNS